MYERSALLNGNEDSRNLFQCDKKGLSVMVAAAFVLGTTCGGGMLALPKAMENTGWSGVPLMILVGTTTSYTGYLLGKCWLILRTRYPEYTEETVFDPYAEIGFRAAGIWGRYTARTCVDGTSFGSAVVYLLLISGNTSNLLRNTTRVDLPACFIVLIVSAVLTSLTWLGTPKDFWQAGIFAAATSILCGIFIIAGLTQMVAVNKHGYANPTFESSLSALGSFVFAFGAVFAFPCIQVDMKNPDKFSISIVIATCGSIVIYCGVAIPGFVILGSGMEHSNILDDLEPGWTVYTALILITIHLLMAFLIILNPLSQDMDKLFNVENKCSFKRCLLRTALMLLVMFVALSIPHFGVILSLVGGTLITASAIVLPPLFYLLINHQKQLSDAHGPPPRVSRFNLTTVFEDQSVTNDGCQSSPSNRNKETWPYTNIRSYDKMILCGITLFGIVSTIACTFSVAAKLVRGSSGFTVPCYVNWTAAN